MNRVNNQRVSGGTERGRYLFILLQIQRCLCYDFTFGGETVQIL